MENEKYSELGQQLFKLTGAGELDRLSKLSDVLSQEHIDTINEMEASSTSQLTRTFNVKSYNGKTKNHTVCGFDVTIMFLNDEPYAIALKNNVAVSRDGRKITNKDVGSPYVVASNCTKIYNIAVIHKIPKYGDAKVTTTLHRII